MQNLFYGSIYHVIISRGTGTLLSRPFEKFCHIVMTCRLSFFKSWRPIEEPNSTPLNMQQYSTDRSLSCLDCPNILDMMPKINAIG